MDSDRVDPGREGDLATWNPRPGAPRLVAPKQMEDAVEKARVQQLTWHPVPVSADPSGVGAIPASASFEDLKRGPVEDGGGLVGIAERLSLRGKKWRNQRGRVEDNPCGR